jgi:membrane protease YdiL (CAAX protease family)
MQDTTIRHPVIGPWQAILLFIALWIAVTAFGPLLRAMLGVHPTAPRDIVAWRAATGLPLSWLALGGTALILRLRGQGLADLGFAKRARPWGWIAAAAVVAFFLWNSVKTPYCRGQCFIDPAQWLSDWSAFRLATSVAIGVTAGICEETMFRGFVMAQARDGGAPAWAQVLLSGVLFGVAHAGLAGLSGHFVPAAAIGIVAGTTVFGAVFALVYLAAGRSLVPLMLAHGLFAFTTEPWMMLWGLARTMG